MALVKAVLVRAYI